MPSSITLFIHYFSAKKYILRPDFCFGQHTFQIVVFFINFHPPSSTSFDEFACYFSAGSHLSNAENYIGQQDIKYMCYDDHF
jgi:hypothetical protein